MGQSLEALCLSASEVPPPPQGSRGTGFKPLPGTGLPNLTLGQVPKSTHSHPMLTGCLNSVGSADLLLTSVQKTQRFVCSSLSFLSTCLISHVAPEHARKGDHKKVGEERPIGEPTSKSVIWTQGPQALEQRTQATAVGAARSLTEEARTPMWGCAGPPHILGA